MVGASLVLGGCASSERGVTGGTLLSHPVFFGLEDPSDAGELIADCDAWIATIPEVATYHCGVPFESGRSTVDASYDVGLVVGFESAGAYSRYVEHPNHVRLVEKWRPRLRELLVRDVIDEGR